MNLYQVTPSHYEKVIDPIPTAPNNTEIEFLDLLNTNFPLPEDLAWDVTYESRFANSGVFKVVLNKTWNPGEENEEVVPSFEVSVQKYRQALAVKQEADGTISRLSVVAGSAEPYYYGQSSTIIATSPAS